MTGTAVGLDPHLTRRWFLHAGAAIGGGLVIGWHLPAAAAPGAAFAPNAFVRIGRDGSVALTIPQVEMGQGTYTSMAMLIAEELDVELTQVQVEHAAADEKDFANPLLGFQVTGGSTSVRAFYLPLRQAGAAARTMLIAAAADRWQVDPSGCHTEAGVVVHDASSRRLSYADLVDAAADLPVPAEVQLKDPSTFRIIGTPAKRLDVAGKVNGTAVYGIDVKVPGMKIATVAASPVFGGTVRTFDEAAALKVAGVHRVVALDNAVAVIADHYWAAKQGLEAAAVQFDDGPNAALGTADIVAAMAKASEQKGAVAQSVGDAAAAFETAATKVEAVYEAPFLAHATMEPINCTVHVRGDGCDVWVGSQVVGRAQATAAEVTGLPLDKVTVHNQFLGGGFGRRLEVDYVTQAVRIAKQVDHPVKVVWSREEDIQHDMYRPYYLRPDQGRPRQRRDAGGLEPQDHRLVDPRTLAFRRPSRTIWTSMPSTAPSTFPTPSPTSPWTMSGTSRRESPPPSGVASARPTTSTWSRASSTSWRRRPGRTRWPIVEHSWPAIPAPSPCSSGRPGWRAGERRSGRARGAASRSSMSSAPTSPRLRRCRSPRPARCAWSG